MSQENLEMVRTLLGAFDRADYEAALEALDSEIEWQVPPGIAIGREVYRGRDEVQRGFAEWLAAWDTHRFEPDEMLDHGDHVVVFTLRDKKVTRHRSYRDRSEALEAAGLRE